MKKENQMVNLFSSIGSHVLFFIHFYAKGEKAQTGFFLLPIYRFENRRQIVFASSIEQISKHILARTCQFHAIYLPTRYRKACDRNSTMRVIEDVAVIYLMFFFSSF